MELINFRSVSTGLYDVDVIMISSSTRQLDMFPSTTIVLLPTLAVSARRTQESPMSRPCNSMPPNTAEETCICLCNLPFQLCNHFSYY